MCCAVYHGDQHRKPRIAMRQDEADGASNSITRQEETSRPRRHLPSEDWMSIQQTLLENRSLSFWSNDHGKSFRSRSHLRAAWILRGNIVKSCSLSSFIQTRKQVYIYIHTYQWLAKKNIYQNPRSETSKCRSSKRVQLLQSHLGTNTNHQLDAFLARLHKNASTNGHFSSG
jgi:hypothetical protein